MIEIAGLPQVSDPTEVDLLRVLEIHNTDECREFRQWLSTIDSASDPELSERVASQAPESPGCLEESGKGAPLGCHDGTGRDPRGRRSFGDRRKCRRLVPCGRLFAGTGPITFLTQDYPSIFSRQGERRRREVG